MKLLLEIHRYLCNLTALECLFCFSVKCKKSMSAQYFDLTKIVEICVTWPAKNCKNLCSERGLFTST